MPATPTTGLAGAVWACAATENNATTKAATIVDLLKMYPLPKKLEIHSCCIIYETRGAGCDKITVERDPDTLI